MGRKVKVHEYRTKMGHGSSFNVRVTVNREQGMRAKHAFYACATIKSGGRGHLGKRYADDRIACEHARAPRRAIAAALRSLSSAIVKRSSAFRGR